MQKELEELHRRLFKAKARAERAMAVLIAGVPGSGKTHLARQYVFAQRECYTGGIFWIDAKSRESAYKGFWEIAQAATLVDHKEAEDPNYQKSRTYVNAVRNWLQSRNEWLLVFDGITFDHDDDINDFRPFLPWNRRCSIIYTSIDATLRKKQRLFEPYCLHMPRLKVEDACRLLYKDLGIRRPTVEQASKATELVEHYECLPLAIHAIGHRLNATGKPIERYRVKHQVTDKKLAEPFLCIMNDLYRLNQREALNLINLLSFLDHHVPVGLLMLGRSIMTVENAEIMSSAQSGEEPDLDTTLGTLIHYGLVERTSDADLSFQHNGSAQTSSDEMHAEPKPTPQLTDSFTESSQDGFFSIYRGNSVVDVVKIHSVVQGFCRDELKIKDEEYKDLKQNPGFYDSWLIVATRFLCRSYETAKERMAHYHDCGLVRDYREYETHASRLLELFPKKSAIGNHPHVLREAHENLRQLMKSISSEIDRMSPSSSQESARNQKSVFDRSSSSSSSFPESSADEGGLSRQSTWNWTESGSIRAESPEEMMVPPRFKLELFPPHIFRQQAGSESEDGYETDGEAKEAPRISPALSQMSQTTERPKEAPHISPALSQMSHTTERPKNLSSSPPVLREDTQEWQLVERHSRTRPTGPGQKSKRPRGPGRFRGAKPDTPVVKISQIQGRGSSSRVPSDHSEGSSILASAAETALAAVRRISGGMIGSDMNTPLSNKENVPTWASIAARRMLEANETPSRRPALKPSVESLDSQSSHVFASPLSHELLSHELPHELSQEIIPEPLARSTYSDPGRDHLEQSLGALDLHTAPTSQINSRRPSIQANIEPAILSASTPSVFPYGIPIRELSASTPSLVQYPPSLLPYDQDITITIPQRRSQRASGPAFSSPMAPKPVAVAHPSAIMPGALPLSATASESTVIQTERPGSEALSRGSSNLSHQSWATEPVRSPPRFSPASSFAQPSDITRSPTPLLQQHALSSTGSWTSDRPLSSSVSAIQSDNLYPILPQNHRRLGSVDERLRNMELAWDPAVDPTQLLHFSGHRVDVRDARLRLQEVGRLQTPRHIPTYELYHSNMSGPLIQGDGHVYAPARALEVYGVRARSGSSPSRPEFNGLGVQFNDRVFD
jgi:tRNA A37 threonylcarbamoyladenosine biosynthesis protein TsaE